MARAPFCQENAVRKPVKPISKYICLACETPHEQFALSCHTCFGSDTVVPMAESEWEDLENEQTKPRRRATKALLIPSELPQFTSTGRKAWDIVLGGGLVRPSSVLVPGPKGVGKTTSLLAIADTIGTRLRRPVLYGSAEMPGELVRQVCDRLKLTMKFLYINDSGNAEDMHEDIADIKPVIIVWDSIQRFRVNGELGTLTLRDVVCGAIESGQRVKAASLLVSHVTKDDDFMGENGIGHDVDVVLTLRKVDQNLVAVECREKNRFAITPLTATEPLY